MASLTQSPQQTNFHGSIIRCAERPDGIDFAAYWYRFAGIEDFLICTKCFEDHLEDTALARDCIRFYIDPLPGDKVFCWFNTERSHALLRDGKLASLTAYARRRADIPSCPGTRVVRGEEGVRWFVNEEMSEFAACEACREDCILATPWADRFELRKDGDGGAENDDFPSCSMAVSFIRRNLRQCGAECFPWAKFVDSTNYRLAMPQCRKAPVDATSRRWLSPAKPWLIPQLKVCETCFLDAAGEQPNMENFLERTIKPFETQSKVICSLQTRSLRVCTSELIEQDYLRWHDIASQIVVKPPCTSDGVVNGIWYKLLRNRHNLSSEIVNFDVCAGCYAGLIKNTRHEAYFKKKQYPFGTSRVCDLHPENGRGASYLQVLKHSLFTGQIRHLTDYALRLSSVPVCAGSQSLVNRQWWGMDEFFFCSSCYEEVGRATYFEPYFQYHGKVLATASCSMYSENARRRYKEACRHQYLGSFIAYCLERAQAKSLLEQQLALEQEQSVPMRHRRFDSVLGGSAGFHDRLAFHHCGSNLYANGPLYGPVPGSSCLSLYIPPGQPQSPALVPHSSNVMVDGCSVRRRWTELE